MLTPREGLDAVKVVVPDGYGGATPYMYVVGGRDGSRFYLPGPPEAPAYTLTTVERAPILTDGALGPFVALAETMNQPRAFFPLLTSQGQNAFVSRDTIFDSDETLRLIAVTGDDFWDDYTTPITGANGGTTTIEACTINPDGSTTPWTTQTLSAVKSNHGNDALLFFNALFIFNGVKSESLGSYPSAHGGTTQRLIYDPAATALPQSVFTGSSSSNETPQNRAYLSTVRLNGYVYAIGGVDGGAPIAAIDRGH
jgi:hypothetical protein